MAGRGCTCTPGGVYCPQCAGNLARAVPQRPSLPTPPVVTASPPLSETQFLRQVLDLAALGGWRCYHPWLSIHSQPGWPDLAAAKAGEPLVLAELKTTRGKLTPAQREWLALLREVPGVDVYLWTPADLDVIEARFLRR